MKVVEDLRAGGINVVAGGLLEATRVHEVTEITGVPSYSVLRVALGASAGGVSVPQYGEPHPDAQLAAEGLVVVSQDVAPRGGEGGTVSSVYKRPTVEEAPGFGMAAAVWELSSFTVTESGERRDVNGATMEIGYSFGGTNLTEWIRGDLTYTQIRATARWADSTPRTDLMRAWGNSINATGWSGDGPREWLLEQIRSSPIQSDSRWLVYADFLWDPRTHLRRGEISWGTTVPPGLQEPSSPGAGDGNGIAYFKRYRELDFNALGLEVPLT